MANICENVFYASGAPENIEAISKFFKGWKYEGDANIEDNGEDIDVYFNSKWTFPEEDMEDLLNSLPNKDDIYMRCLSVEYGCLYHELYVCDGEDGWKPV